MCKRGLARRTCLPGSVQSRQARQLAAHIARRNALAHVCMFLAFRLPSAPEGGLGFQLAGRFFAASQTSIAEGRARAPEPYSKLEM